MVTVSGRSGLDGIGESLEDAAADGFFGVGVGVVRSTAFWPRYSL